MHRKLGLAIAMLAIMLASAQAQSEPVGCSATGVGLSLTAFRDDGITPIGGADVDIGEDILYRATLVALPFPNCYFEGGSLLIETPDGAVTDVTALGGIPTVNTTDSFVSEFVNYTVTEEDIVVLPHLIEEHIIANAIYENGTALLGDGSPVEALTSLETHVQLEDINVTKDAQPIVERNVTWEIVKTVDPDFHNLTVGEAGLSEYNVTLTKTVDETYSVQGNITIYNPSLFSDANVTDVLDELNGINADVDCGVAFPYLLGPDSTLTCTYSAYLPDNATLTNFVDVTTEGVIGGGNATADVNFADAIVLLNGYEEVTVNDTNGESWMFADSGVQTYTRDFICDGVEFTDGVGQYTHPNTATILETGQNDDAEVLVECRQIIEGCTLTQGYWKTHSEYGPAPYDNTWAMLPSGADTVFFLSGQTYYEVFQTPVKGNAYFNLAHQYMAAQLNALAGASLSAVQDAYDDATSLLNTYTPAQIEGLKGNDPVRQEFIYLAGVLDSYNMGSIGPGHCEG